jgi:hypothetical protein
MGVCHLKGAVFDWVPRAGFVSGLPAAQVVGTDRYGNDTRGVQLSAARQELCYAECARDPQCTAYAYTASAGVFTNYCWLKSAAGTQTPNAPIVSGAKRPFEVGFDRAGVASDDDYAINDASNGVPDDCAAQCSADDECHAFTFGPQGGEEDVPKCHLKRFAFDPVLRSGYTSGVKRGLEVNTSRPGGTYKTFLSLGGERPEVCQAACATDPECQAWTMIPEANATTSAQCELKSQVPAPTRRTRYVSGLKGGEFFGADAPY